MAAANRVKNFVKDFTQIFFDGNITETAALIVFLEFSDFGSISCEGVQIREDDVAFNVAGVGNFYVRRVGVHILNLRGDGCAVIA